MPRLSRPTHRDGPVTGCHATSDDDHARSSPPRHPLNGTLAPTIDSTSCRAWRPSQLPVGFFTLLLTRADAILRHAICASWIGLGLGPISCPSGAAVEPFAHQIRVAVVVRVPLDHVVDSA